MYATIDECDRSLHPLISCALDGFGILVDVAQADLAFSYGSLQHLLLEL